MDASYAISSCAVVIRPAWRGSRGLDAAVDVFYRKVLSDDRVSHFFDDVDMDRQIAKQKAFLTIIFGGPVAYTGKDMRAGHAHLLQRGLNDSHVDVVIQLSAEPAGTRRIRRPDRKGRRNRRLGSRGRAEPVTP